MDRDEALKVLRGGKDGVAEWNRRGKGEEIPSLDSADLSRVNMSYAYLINANLSSANLTGANLNSAKLGSANLTGAKLNETQFHDASCIRTVWGGNDLSLVKGLDSVKHSGPSVLGVDTILQSRGNIPQAFLEGCGVPDNWITYLPSLLGEPIDLCSCFIPDFTNWKDHDAFEASYRRLMKDFRPAPDDS